ncbi:MAG: S1 RNA-binding domain-containing protein [Chloroflexi bacterium]|nr:MAG: S1 RNA-binding domain-containing protein [Chloroflexota bacterium]
MNLETTPDPSHHLDDAYWQALFQQEDTLDLPSSDEHTQSFDSFSVPSYEEHYPTETENPWELAQQLLEADELLELKVIGYNKGGLLVRWNGLQGFVPASQLTDLPQFHLPGERLRALRQWMGHTLTLKIIEVNPRLNRLILSERASRVKAETKERILSRLKPGDIIEGTITNLTDFGAFVDLGGVEGLIHLSELSWSRVTHPGHIVKPQQKVKVKVLNVDLQNERIALSLKRLKRNPWEGVESRYYPGQLVEGIVSNVVNFGAFVQLEDELEGLVHISELAEGVFLHPRNVVQVGDRVVARVLSVNGEAKRLALSLRNVPSANGQKP